MLEQCKGVIIALKMFAQYLEESGIDAECYNYTHGL